MDAPVLKIITRESAPVIFNNLMEDKDKVGFAKLCAKSTLQEENVGSLADNATHIIMLIQPVKKLKAFAFISTTHPDYLEILLLCGSYRFSYGGREWRGSEVLIDKAMQLAIKKGKASIRLEALNEDLYEKLYKPMGFTPVPNEYLVYEMKQTGGRLGFNVQRRRTNRNRRNNKHRQLRNLTTRRR